MWQLSLLKVSVAAGWRRNPYKLEAIVGQLENLPEGSHDEGRRRTDHAIIDVVGHSVAEEEHLYPAARRHIPGGDEIADREIAEPRQVTRTSVHAQWLLPSR